MSEPLIQLADAVVSALNGQAFSLSFTAVRSYIGQRELKDLATLAVDVVPGEDTNDIIDREETQHILSVEIGVRQKVNDLTNATLDPLTALVDEIKDYLKFGTLDLDESTTVVWVGTEHGTPARPAYYVEHLSELRQFTAIVTARYQLVQ